MHGLPDGYAIILTLYQKSCVVFMDTGFIRDKENK